MIQRYIVLYRDRPGADFEVNGIRLSREAADDAISILEKAEFRDGNLKFRAVAMLYEDWVNGKKPPRPSHHV